MKKKVIAELYELYKDNNYMEPTKDYKRNLKRFNKTRKKIDESLNKEQKESLSQLLESYGMLNSEEKKQYFITAFKLAMGIAMEVR